MRKLHADLVFSGPRLDLMDKRIEKMRLIFAVGACHSRANQFPVDCGDNSVLHNKRGLPAARRGWLLVFQLVYRVWRY